MSPSPNRSKLDDLLAGAVDLAARPDFSAWRRQHPEAVDSIESLPVILAKRRSKMIRIARYSTSVALVLLVAVGAWWVVFSSGTATAWAQVIEQLSRVRNARCQLSVHRGPETTDTIYIAGDRTRYERPPTIGIADFQKGELLELNTATKKATLRDLVKDSDGRAVRGSNPLADLLKLKDAASKRQPDESIDGVLCHVYRVDKPVFLGWDVPWVKLWIDPRSNLPAQIHTVIADGQIAVTYHDFRWNEPLDESLFSLVAPKGYELVDATERKKGQKVREANSMQAAVAAIDAADGSQANPGRELHGDDVPKTLDVLSRPIEANYKAIVSWSGTYELKMRPPSLAGVSRVVINFHVEPGRDRLRTDYREIRPPQPPVKSAPPQQHDGFGRIPFPPVPEAREWRWVRTPDHSLQFPMNDLRNQVQGFPQAGSGPDQPFRILYREGPGATHLASCSTFVDPRSFIGGNGGLSYWKVCSGYASCLRGNGRIDPDHARKNLVLRQRRNGTATEYVLLIRYRCSDDNDMSANVIGEDVFSSAAAFNVVSHRTFEQGHLVSSEQRTFQQEKGIFIPARIEFQTYQGPNNPHGDPHSKHAMGAMTSHRIFTLQQTKVNEPIDPAVFEMSSLGLRRGDRVADWIEHRVQVFDGKELVPVERFKSGR